ncbi:MAG: hypothetical protein KZQ83_20805 [gamma proteobacterium symbiont of Taylorina sp.]|nr:hypothetical protein [gamma proteobacterium symbiont of Taylorina sp.]
MTKHRVTFGMSARRRPLKILYQIFNALNAVYENFFRALQNAAVVSEFIATGLSSII